MTSMAAPVLTTEEAAAFLYREARLLDTLQLEAWLELFTEDGMYWVPMDETLSPDDNASLVYDDRLRREERVYHLLRTPFPAQQPRSRMVHMVSNVEVLGVEDGAVTVCSNQVIYEVRTGDFTQIGLGRVRPLVAAVEHVLRPVDGVLKIAMKKILLIDRDMPQANLTFLI